MFNAQGDGHEFSGRAGEEGRCYGGGVERVVRRRRSRVRVVVGEAVSKRHVEDDDGVVKMTLRHKCCNG